MDRDDQAPDTHEDTCFCGERAILPIKQPYVCLEHAQTIVWVLFQDLHFLLYGERWEVWRARTIPRLVAALKDMPEGHQGVRTAVN